MNEENKNLPNNENAEAPTATDINTPEINEVHDPFLIPKHIIEPENPEQDATFESLSVPIKDALIESGWTRLMPVQAKTIPYMRLGNDLLIQSKTGSGKTGAFGIPLAEIIEVDHQFPQALILVPTRELATQVNEEIEKINLKTNIKSVALFGGVAYGPQINAIKNGVHIVVATPGRLLDLLEKRYLDFKSLRDLVLDEADEMLSMGFYPDINRIKTYLPKQHCTTMFSATIAQNIKSLAREFQSPNAKFLSLSYEKVGADNLEHRYYVVDPMEKDTTVIKILELENPDSCLIFCNMKKDVQYICDILNSYGFNAQAISGDISQSQREKTLANFKSKRLPILIATDVAARGIDVSHVSHVIIFDHPDDHEVYIHRSGRTARAGRSGVAISITTPLEEKEIRQTSADFNIKFIKMPNITNDQVDEKIRERTLNFLEQSKRTLGQKAKSRIPRYLPLVDELSSVDDTKELLAYLLDRYYWEEFSRKK